MQQCSTRLALRELDACVATSKTRAFARARAEGKGLKRNPYAEAGYQVHAGNAYRLSKNEQICRRVLEIQSQSVQRTVTTIEDMIAQIDEDRRFARERGHSAAALAASMGKAKLLGFLAGDATIRRNGCARPMLTSAARATSLGAGWLRNAGRC